MSELKPIQIAGWLKDVNDNFDTLEPLIAGDGDGLGVLRVARYTFDADASDSAGASNKTVAAHGMGVTIPANAIVCGGFMDVLVVGASADSTATIAVSVKSANDIQTAAAVSGAPWSSTGKKAIVPKANTPESTGIKLTAAAEITVTIAVQALTGGKFVGYLYYVEGEATP